MRKNLTTKLAAFAVWSLTGPLAWGQQTAEMDWQAFGKKSDWPAHCPSVSRIWV